MMNTPIQRSLMPTTLHYAWKKHEKREKFRTGISLHSHTWHSKESLGFFPELMAKVTPFARLLARAEGDFKKKWDGPIDYERSYWTSPVSPEAAFALEAAQIEAQSLAPLISLSDHDEIAANLELRHVHKKDVPISLEWTIPFAGMVFHVGMHNLPEDKSAALLQEMREATKDPSPARLTNIFTKLDAFPDALIVLNHPFTDQGRIAHEIPEPTVKDFLKHYGRWIHALEANALQSWETNRRVITLAAAMGLPVISGGDRHGFEPNGMVNLTQARSFAEFVHEVRRKKKSDILLLPQSRESLFVRYADQVGEILAFYPSLNGRSYWHDRIFCLLPNGEFLPLTSMAAPDSPTLATVNRYLRFLELLMAGLLKPISPVLTRTKESDI